MAKMGGWDEGGGRGGEEGGGVERLKIMESYCSLQTVHFHNHSFVAIFCNHSATSSTQVSRLLDTKLRREFVHAHTFGCKLPENLCTEIGCPLG